MHKIKTIIRKEWAEVFKNRMVLFTVIFLPLMMTALPLIILFATRDAGMESIDTELPEQFAQFCSEDLSAGQCFQVYMVSQFLLMFMMIPLIIPINIAAYSIVGEKTTHSLEPLLATPITTAELLTAKNLAATIPAVLATWVGFGIFAAGALIISGRRFLTGCLVGPLITVLSVNFSIMVSSRVNDPRRRAGLNHRDPTAAGAVLRANLGAVLPEQDADPDHRVGAADPGYGADLYCGAHVPAREYPDEMEVRIYRRERRARGENLFYHRDNREEHY
jgi:ABC-2 type transport system permease protein